MDYSLTTKERKLLINAPIYISLENTIVSEAGHKRLPTVQCWCRVKDWEAVAKGYRVLANNHLKLM